MRIISDTGPIIGLAKIDQIHLLKKMASEVIIAPFVQRELYGKIGPESDLIDQALDDFIQVATFSNSGSALYSKLNDLDDGERQSICLASSFSEKAILLIDDYVGRRAAEKLTIPIIGTVGILITAKKKGLVNSVGSLLQIMRQNGYWLSDELISIAKKLSKE